MHVKVGKVKLAMWHTPIILALRVLKQDHESGASLDRVNFRSF